MAESKRRVAAILSADVAGYSRLMGAAQARFRAPRDRTTVLGAWEESFRKFGP